MQTCVLDISYYGKPFSGFAKQPGQLTVQGSLEDALRVIFQNDIETTCAGRTDAGVHARHQYVSFLLPESAGDFDNGKITSIQKSIEQLSHDDVHVNNVKIFNGEFSARFDAKQRHYSYFLCNQKCPSLLLRDFSWHQTKPLDLDSMKKASRYLIGEHDFKSFCVAASSKDKSTMRNVSNIDITKNNIYGDNIIEIKVSGNAFLHSMVRTIVGSLVKVGTNNREAEWMLDVLEAKDRQAAGECAPAKGLIFMDVDY